jgi:hypothetical protein
MPAGTQDQAGNYDSQQLFMYLPDQMLSCTCLAVELNTEAQRAGKVTAKARVVNVKVMMACLSVLHAHIFVFSSPDNGDDRAAVHCSRLAVFQLHLDCSSER